jgi:ribosome maturation factor RimP
MTDTDLITKIRDLVEPIVSVRGLEIFDIEFKNEGNEKILRIYIDKDTGVTLKDCEDVSIVLGTVLDANDLIKEHYLLEISSPGLYRELRSEKDFLRYLNHRIKIKLKEAINNQKVFVGKLIEYNNGKIVLLLENNTKIEFLVQNIEKANLSPEDKDLFKK